MIFLLTLCIVSLCMAMHWCMAKRYMKASYILALVSASLAMVLNTSLFLKDESNYGILLFHVLCVWQIAMAIKGLRGGKHGETQSAD